LGIRFLFEPDFFSLRAGLFGIADLRDDFERETEGFTFKIIPLLSNADFFGNRLNLGIAVG
jgi:hypothetical protein